MSMNLICIAARICYYKDKNGNMVEFIQRQTIPLMQTPTAVSYQLIEQPDIFAAYCDWVASLPPDNHIVHEFSKDDIWGDEPPIASHTVDLNLERIEETRNTIAELLDECYTIHFTVI